MLKAIVFSLTLCATVNGWANTTYTTSTGAVFTQVQGPGSFGVGWKDPNGLIWSAYQGDYNNIVANPDQNYGTANTPATEACVKIGGLLPTRNDYVNLLSYFDRYFSTSGMLLTEQGRTDLYALFPEMSGRDFWTSSGWNNSYCAERFNGVYGYVTGGSGDPDNIAYRSLKLGIKCVTQ